MFLVITVASLCGVVLIGGLMRLACRHRAGWWFTSDDAILCLVSPVIILLLTFGGVSIGYRMTHGGFRAVPVEGWIGAVVILAISAGIWALLARWIRRGEGMP
jgi:hypothetical protein